MSGGKEPPKSGVKLNLDEFRLRSREIVLSSGVRLRVLPLTLGRALELKELLRKVSEDDHEGFGRAFIRTTCRFPTKEPRADAEEPEDTKPVPQKVVDTLPQEDLEAFAREFPFLKALQPESEDGSSPSCQEDSESRLAYLHRLVRCRLARWRQRLEVAAWGLPPGLKSFTQSDLVSSSISDQLRAMDRATRMPYLLGEYMSSFEGLERQIAQADVAAKIVREASRAELAVAGQFKALAHQYMLGEYISSFEGLERQIAQADLAARIVREASSAELAVAGQFKTIADQFTAIEDSIAGMAKTLSRQAAVADDVTRALNRSLVPATALFGTSELSQLRLDLALRPHASFETFTSQLFVAANAGPDIFRSNTLGIFSAASELLAEMADVAAITANQLTDVPPLSQLPEVNVFTVLGRELDEVDFGRGEINAAEIVVNASPSQVVLLGAKIVKLVFDLNLEAEREGNDLQFKPTNKNLLGCSILSSLVAYDEHSFGQVVDHLFFLLYEGSGDGQRLVNVVTDDQFQALMTLKHLRVSLRHDPDHGEAAKATKKSRRIGAIFGELIGRSVPRTSEEWAKAQVELYRKLVGLLDSMWEE